MGGGGGQGGTINTKQERFDGSHEASPELIEKLLSYIASPRQLCGFSMTNQEDSWSEALRWTTIFWPFGSSVCHKLENSIPSAAFLCNFPDRITDGISQCDEAGFMPTLIC